MIELAIVNAGVNHAIGKGAEAENWDIATAVLAVNLDGALPPWRAQAAATRRRSGSPSSGATR